MYMLPGSNGRETDADRLHLSPEDKGKNTELGIFFSPRDDINASEDPAGSPVVFLAVETEYRAKAIFRDFRFDVGDGQRSLGKYHFLLVETETSLAVVLQSLHVPLDKKPPGLTDWKLGIPEQQCLDDFLGNAGKETEFPPVEHLCGCPGISNQFGFFPDELFPVAGIKY